MSNLNAQSFAIIFTYNFLNLDDNYITNIQSLSKCNFENLNIIGLPKYVKNHHKYIA